MPTSELAAVYSAAEVIKQMLMNLMKIRNDDYLSEMKPVIQGWRILLCRNKKLNIFIINFI